MRNRILLLSLTLTAALGISSQADAVKYYSRQRLGSMTTAAPAATHQGSCGALQQYQVPLDIQSGKNMGSFTTLAAAKTACETNATAAGVCYASGSGPYTVSIDVGGSLHATPGNPANYASLCTYQ